MHLGNHLVEGGENDAVKFQVDLAAGLHNFRGSAGRCVVPAQRDVHVPTFHAIAADKRSRCAALLREGLLRLFLRCRNHERSQSQPLQLVLGSVCNDLAKDLVLLLRRAYEHNDVRFRGL